MSVHKLLPLVFLSIFIMAVFGAASPLIFSSLQVSEDLEKSLYDAPEFSLPDSRGGEFHSSSMKDKIWMFSIFFAACQGPCPIINGHLHNIQEKFKSRPEVKIVSLTADPKNDTPEVLREYAKKIDADDNVWSFLSGTPEEIEQLATDGFKLAADTGTTVHSTRVALIDRKGRIRSYYDGIDAKEMKRLERDIAIFLKTHQ